jgi:hypothetical protein
LSRLRGIGPCRPSDEMMGVAAEDCQKPALNIAVYALTH